MSRVKKNRALLLAAAILLVAATAGVPVAHALPTDPFAEAAGTSTAVLTTPTTLASLTTTFAAGTNFVVGVIQCQNTASGAADVAAAGFTINDGATVLRSNAFQYEFQKTADGAGATRTWVGIALESGAAAGVAYTASATASILGLNCAAQLLAINGVTGSSSNGVSTAISSASSTTLVTDATTFSAGNNVIFGTIETQNTGASAIEVAAGGMLLARSSTTLSSNVFAIYHAASANATYDYQTQLLLAADPGVGANPSYNLQAKASAAGVNGVANIVAINLDSSGLLEAFNNGGSTAVGTSQTTTGSVSTTIGSGSTYAVVFGAVQFHNTGSTTVSTAAGGQVLQQNNVAATQAATIYSSAYSGNAANDDGRQITLVNSYSSIPSSPAYENKVTDSAAGVNAAGRTLVITLGVVQPVKFTVSPSGAPPTSWTVSGCQTLTLSVSGDGASHNVLASLSCTLTFSRLNSGAQRWVFSGGGSSTSVTTCASGTCSTFSQTYYDQDQNTYLIWPHPVSTPWTSGLSFAVTGTVYGGSGAAVCSVSPVSSSTPTLPSGVLSYLPIPLTNTQSSAVAGGTQVQVNVNWNAYSSYLNAQASNVVFFNSAGTTLNAWMQSFASTSDTSDPVWIQLDPGGIPASSSTTIFLGFYSTATNNFSPTGDWGEAPTISGTYGQYDNGAQVFTLYDNFAGTSLSSNWVSQGSAGGSYTVNNGITITVGAATDYSWIHTPATEAYPLTVESDILSQSGNAYITIGDSLATTINTPYGEPYNGYDFDWYSGTYVELDHNTATNSLATSYTYTGFSAGIWSFSWYATGHQAGTDGTHPLTDTNSGTLIGNYYLYLGIGEFHSGNFAAQWYRARVTPPNNVLPAYSQTCTGWADYNTQVSFPTNPTGSAPNTRWQVDGDPDQTVTPKTGGNTFQEQYWSQLQNTYQATPSNPSAWDAALSIPVTGSQLGAGGQTVCAIAASSGGGAASCAGYADFDTLVTMSSPVAVSGTEQWAASGGNTFADTTGGNSHNVNYVDQFQVTFRSVPAGQGTTVPTGTAWMNFGSDAISATPSAGASFSLWSSTGSISIASPSSASTTATVSGTGTITASFATLVSDSFLFSDSPSSAVLLPRAAADSYTFSDLVARVLAFPRATSDAFGFGDLVVRAVALPRSASDAFTFIESVLGSVVLPRSASDSFAYSDSASRQIAYPRGVADGSVFTDVSASVLSLARGTPDAFAFSDMASRAALFSRSATDAFGFLDSAVSSLSFGRTASDNFPVSDAASSLLSLTRLPMDSFSFTDVASRLSVLGRAAADLFTFADSPQGGLQLARGALDSFLISDLSNRLVSLTRGAADSYIFSEMATSLQALSRGASDSFGVVDSALQNVLFGRGASDLFSFSDVVSRVLSLARAPVDFFTFSDNVFRGLGLNALVSDAFNFVDSVKSALGLARASTDSFVFSDLPTRIAGLIRGVQDSFPFSDGLARLLQLTRSAIDSFPFSDSLGGVVKEHAHIFAFINDGFIFFDNAARQLYLGRGLLDVFKTGDAMTRSLLLVRSTLDNWLFGDSASRLAALSQSVADMFKNLESVFASLNPAGTTSSSSATTSGPNGNGRPGFILEMLGWLLLLLLAILVAIALYERRRKKDDDRQIPTAG